MQFNVIPQDQGGREGRRYLFVVDNLMGFDQLFSAAAELNTSKCISYRAE